MTLADIKTAMGDVDRTKVPMPATVSAEARAFLETLTPGSPIGELKADTVDGWRTIVALGDQYMASRTRVTAASFKGVIQKHSWDGVDVFEITPDEIAANNENRAIFYVHGGAFLFGGAELCAEAAKQHAQAGACRVFAVDYRMPPDHPFPIGLQDAVTAYRRLIQTYDPPRIGVIGLSAGGGLAAAVVLKLRDSGTPMPGALVLLSPEADLLEAGDSFRAGVYPMTFAAINTMYANGADLRNPYISAVYGDFSKGYPPTMITSGTRDYFLSNCVLLHRKLRRANLISELHVWEAMPHGGFGGNSPEDRDLLEETVRFLQHHLAAT